MFKIFGFGQLIVGSDKVFAGQTQAVKDLNKPVTVAGATTRADAALEKWLEATPDVQVKEVLGADWVR